LEVACLPLILLRKYIIKKEIQGEKDARELDASWV
jgi:hypothetical protein